MATLTDLCARGRKRGIAPIIAAQRLAKLSSSVISELQNFLIGITVTVTLTRRRLTVAIADSQPEAV